jgi:hypothetical protein
VFGIGAGDRGRARWVDCSLAPRVRTAVYQCSFFQDLYDQGLRLFRFFRFERNKGGYKRRKVVVASVRTEDQLVVKHVVKHVEQDPMSVEPGLA